MKNDKFIEDVNFIRINDLYVTTSRFLIWLSTKAYRFIDIDKGHLRYGPSEIPLRNITKDDDGYYQEEQLQIYYSSQYYLSHDIKEHYITSSTIIDVLASIGGLHRIIKILFKFIGGKFNQKVLNTKFMRNMYFLKKGK